MIEFFAGVVVGVAVAAGVLFLVVKFGKKVNID